MTSAPPDLWADWCTVTGTPVDRRDEAVLALFAKQASPSRSVFEALQPKTEEPPARAWPSAHRGDGTALERLLHHGAALIADPGTHWVARLKLRRLLFAAVLVVPATHGGLSLTRNQALSLMPQQFQQLCPRIRRVDDQASCPACGVWSWLDVLGTNSGWSRSSVRALGYQRDDLTGQAHRHDRPDPSPDWQDHPGLLSVSHRPVGLHRPVRLDARLVTIGPHPDDDDHDREHLRPSCCS